jgi:MFS family permease
MIVSLHASINATLVGMIIFWLPSLILSPYLGAIVDHHDRKKLIILAESVRAIMFVFFGVLLIYQPSLWAIYLLLILAGCFAALYQPLLPTFVHELVPKEQLLYANTNINMAFELGNIIGRGIITVVVLTFLGTYGALFIVALLYILSAVTMIPIQRHHALASNKTYSLKISFIKNIKEGYQYLFSKKELLHYALIQSLILMSLMAAPILIGPYVKTTLQAGNRVFSISEAALSTGTIIGAFFWSFLSHRISKELCLALSSILAGISYLTLAKTNEIHPALIAFLLLGFSWGSFPLIMSTVQLLTDKNYQGRVQASIGVAVTIVFICFAIFLYHFDTHYNAQSAFILLSVLCVFILIGIFLAKYSTKDNNNLKIN